MPLTKLNFLFTVILLFQVLPRSEQLDVRLSREEDEALYDVLHALKVFLMTPDDIPNCNGSRRHEVECDCTYKNATVCHVTKLFFEEMEAEGSYIHENISKLTYLKSIKISNYKLSGKIPDILGTLPALKVLYLELNLLTGPIPSSLGNLSSLETLVLIDNLLSGEIPKALGNLSNLKNMALSMNLLTGPLPPELGNLTRLEYLSLEGNNFTGEVPETYANLTSLTTFTIAGNSINGRIPDFFSKWINLTTLHLIGNEFEGRIPPEILNMSTLEYLGVSDVKDSGFSFPKYAFMSNLYELILRNCSITGQMPSYIQDWPALNRLDLSFNSLSGELPYNLKNKSLYSLILAGNMLNGSIPSWIPTAVSVEGDLSYNNFTNPSINFTEEVLDGLELIIKPSRNYTDEMKEKRCKGGPLYYNMFINCGGEEVTVEGNPYDKDNSTSDFYENPEGKWSYSCSGDLPSERKSRKDIMIWNTTEAAGVFVADAPLYKQTRYCPVSLTYNAFCLRKGSYNLKLHFIENVFTSKEDQSLIPIKRVFDVYVQGERRVKDFSIKDNAKGLNQKFIKEINPIFIDNDLLLDITFFWAGKGSQLYNGPLVSAISLTPNFRIHKKKLSPLEIGGITIGSIILASLLILAFIWKMGFLENKELNDIHIEVADKSFTLKQIIASTRNFSPKHEIGRGRYGIVYKAELGDGIELAVKKIHPDMSKQEKDELLREIFNLKSLRHENLVQLLDGYSNKGLHLLVYEYMENGSLHQALFDPNSTRKLEWRVRYEICIGIAKGLKYLHEEKRFDIVHGNITAKNILLDQSFTAKLSDFGLSSLCREEDPFMAIIKARAARIYMAPEYSRGEVITVKADIYSFGVVLLEIVSGRTNAVYNPNQEADFLLDTAWVLHNRGRILDLVDKELSNSYDRKEAITLLNLAIMCINLSASLRPTISEVVGVLSRDITLQHISKPNKS